MFLLAAQRTMTQGCLEVFSMLVDHIRVVIENGTFSAEDAAFYIRELK